MLEPEPDDSNMPRGRYGIYVGRERESRAIRAYLLDTRKVVVRNKFIPKEITPDIIAIINAIANQDPQIPLESIIESESYKPVPISPTLNVAEIADVGRTFASEGVVNKRIKLEQEEIGSPLSSFELPSRDPPIVADPGASNVGVPIQPHDHSTDQGGGQTEEGTVASHQSILVGGPSIVGGQWQTLSRKCEPGQTANIDKMSSSTPIVPRVGSSNVGGQSSSSIQGIPEEVNDVGTNRILELDRCYRL